MSDKQVGQCHSGGDGYIEAVDNRDIEQNAEQQRQSNLGIAGVVVSAPVLEASGSSTKCR